jgi:hypothetical protein
MTDLIYIGVIIAFFLLALGYVALCDALRKGGGNGS